MMVEHYTYKLTWSRADGMHVGLCAEFPLLSWLADTPEEALTGIRDVVAESVQWLEDDGEPVPEPLATREYSGKFIVRVTPDLHRDLTIAAAEAKTSLNRYVNAKLSR
ncbi:MAG: type II toxin-antitoxin system HicB family antitoxin [Chloroflexi bacterium]|nr:type II toxin-antitoxin system HicB family antitoxin [Chloroflexota bacterium]